jgi:hypothetical protein
VRNTKRRGKIVEIAFLHTVANMGFAVTKLYGDSEPYDFIVDSGNRLWRVQVKSCLYRNGLTYWMGARHPSPTVPAQGPYTAEQIDILAVDIVPADAWCVIPSERLLAVHLFWPSFHTFRWPLENANNSAKPGTSWLAGRRTSPERGSSHRPRAVIPDRLACAAWVLRRNSDAARARTPAPTLSI